MATIDRNTGQQIDGWDEVVQSIAVIITTPIGSRVMRREFGSEVMDLIDRPMTDSVILATYAATAQAIARWETRFELTGVALRQADVDGTVSLELWGTYEGDRRQVAIALGGQLR